MKKIVKRTVQFIVMLLLLALLLQTGISVLAAVSGAKQQDSNEPVVPEVNRTIVISENVLTPLQTRYGREPVNMYEQFLIDFQVHEKHQTVLDQWIVDGVSLTDLLIGYTYLYHQFGQIDHLQSMLVQREQETEWADIFKTYRDEHPLFEPRAFDSELLELWHSTPGMTSDDIMLADLLSFVTATPVEEVWVERTEGKSWKEQAAEAGILYSKDTLPVVPITMEQLEAFTNSTGLNEDQVAQAFVLADKLRVEAEEIIVRMDEGVTEADIYAELLTAAYTIE